MLSTSSKHIRGTGVTTNPNGLTLSGNYACIPPNKYKKCEEIRMPAVRGDSIMVQRY